MDLVRFRRIADAERDRLHQQERLLRKADAAFMDYHLVRAARSLVVQTALGCEYARRRMANALVRNDRVDLYVEGLTFLLFCKVLSSIARSMGQSGTPPQGSLLGDLDEERARRMLRAGHDELLRSGREAWTMAHRLVSKEPDVPAPEKERSLAALTGIVDAVFSLTRAKKLRTALEREGIKAGSDEFAQLLAGTVFEALDGAPP